ncbi:hypothetical protein ACIGZJ_30910 [Kitasatospora sp. NPDC052868]|uniref:DNA polymerase III subunit beta family protein n=1 Tax=Kitasatospora sp. NPDC052868 TaxID=3364060 RepID=UPI0037C5DF93
MSTDTPIRAAVNVRELRRILSQVEPHMNRADWLPAIAGVHLESDGTHLIAIATDRHTMAISRTPLRSDDGPWQATIPGSRIKSLRQWLKAHDSEANIRIGTTGKTITLEGPTDEIHLTATGGDFPKWRAMVATLLADAPQPVPLTALTAEYLGRWATAGCILNASQAAPGKPLILFGDDFLGLQMPVRLQEGHTRAKAAAEWSATLGAADAAPADTHEPETDGIAATVTERLLYRIAVATADAMELPHPADPHLLGTYAITSSNAWTAYRLLEGMRNLSPARTAKLLTRIEAELEAGDFSEAAWEYAMAAGHDPEKWVDEHQAERKKHAEKAAAEAPPAG